MTTIKTRRLYQEKDGVEGYIAHRRAGAEGPRAVVDSPALRSHRLPQDCRL